MKLVKSSTKRVASYNSPLSKREAALLADWERARRAIISMKDLREALGPAAKDVAYLMVRKGVLGRVGRGRYLVRPLRTQGRPTAASAPVLAAAFMLGKRYYAGGLWALSFHRLTEQQHASTLDVFSTKKNPPRTLGHVRLLFHRVRPAALTYGTAGAEVEGVGIVVSTPERTLLDLLDLPALAGGTAQALRYLEAALPKVSTKVLVEYAARGSRTSTCQRLGVVLERAGVPGRELRPLAHRVRETRSVLSMASGYQREGPVNRRWRVVENDR